MDVFIIQFSSLLLLVSAAEVKTTGGPNDPNTHLDTDDGFTTVMIVVGVFFVVFASLAIGVYIYVCKSCVGVAKYAVDAAKESRTHVDSRQGVVMKNYSP
jgi:hypothetical protein